MLDHDLTLTRDDDGKEIALSTCRCCACENHWFVLCAPEFQPSYCPYCGIKFLYYDNNDGQTFNLAGQPLD